MRKLRIEECKLKEIDLLNMEELELDCCKVSDLSFCANVKKFTYCLVFGNQGSVDVSCRERLEECSLALDGFIKNLQKLSNLKKLTIQANEHISDVSCLRKIRELSLTSCHDITDVHWLPDAHELRLIECSGVTDVSALGNIHTLHITAMFPL
jgi:Leucine-rich repeat (LRR) protein